MASKEEIQRCPWAEGDVEYARYHDEEWGVPMTDSRALFEKLTLEGFQAGLSWITVLRKRERYREVLFGFDVQRVAQMSDAEIIDKMTKLAEHRIETAQIERIVDWIMHAESKTDAAELVRLLSTRG